MDFILPSVAGEVDYEETVVDFCDVESEGIGQRGPSQVRVADNSIIIVPSKCCTEIIVINFIKDFELFKSVRVN